MFKKLGSVAIFCMLCSGLISSLHASCPCKKRKVTRTVEQPTRGTDVTDEKEHENVTH